MQIKNIAFWNVDELGVEMVERSRRALGTLIVPEDMSAINVGQAVDVLGPHTQIVVLVDTDNRATGLFVPGEFRENLSRLIGIQADSLSEALTMLANDPAEQLRNFHHEAFNLDRPRVAWCQRGAHYSRNPCPIHG